MPIDKTNRHAFIGASETAAILGLSPYMSASDVYWHKVAPEADNDKPTEAMQTGNRLESALLDYASERTGIKLIPNSTTIVSGRMGATPDGLAVDAKIGFDSKVTSFVDDWGEEMTDQIPEHYYVQMQQQMEVCDLEVVWVPVFMLAGFRPEWRLYRVNRDKEIGGQLRETVEEWWKRHIDAKVVPDGLPAPMNVLKSIRRNTGSQIVLDSVAGDCATAYQKMQEEAKKIEEALDLAKRDLIERLGDAQVGLLPDGRMLSYKTQAGPRRVEFDILQTKYPNVYDEVVAKSEHPVFRILKAKGKK